MQKFYIFEDLKNINKHRGPDSIKFLKDKKYLILFRRLSIIDVSKKANQPFEDPEKKLDLYLMEKFITT